MSSGMPKGPALADRSPHGGANRGHGPKGEVTNERVGVIGHRFDRVGPGRGGAAPDPAIVEGDQDVIVGQGLDCLPGGDVVAHTGHEHDGRTGPA